MIGDVINNDYLSSNGLESDLIYNEHVVYDTAQINLRYLVKVKFEFLLNTD